MRCRDEEVDAGDDEAKMQRTKDAVSTVPRQTETDLFGGNIEKYEFGHFPKWEHVTQNLYVLCRH
jgi:hypothetical protein